jgi:hypothetical protein
VLFVARAVKPEFVEEMLDEGGFLLVDLVVVGSQENDRLTGNFNCEGKCCLSPPAAVLLGRRGTRTVGTAHARAETIPELQATLPTMAHRPCRSG